MTTETPDPIPQDSRNLAVLMWAGTAFLGFIPGLVLYLTRREDAYTQDQAKEALNWSITAIIGYVIGGLLSVFAVGLVITFGIFISNAIFSILGARAASNARMFRVPFALRPIK